MSGESICTLREATGLSVCLPGEVSSAARRHTYSCRALAAYTHMRVLRSAKMLKHVGRQLEEGRIDIQGWNFPS